MDFPPCTRQQAIQHDCMYNKKKIAAFSVVHTFVHVFTVMLNLIIFVIYLEQLCDMRAENHKKIDKKSLF